MAATATARSAAPARRAPVRRSPRRHTPVGGFVPVAVGRTAGAVGGLADSGIFVWLTRGRLWIGLLGTLLVGIVGLNVLALGFSASSSNAAGVAEDLSRENSALRAKIATTLSTEQVQNTASSLGLVVPEPGDINYLSPSPGDAARAAQRLRDGDFAVAAYVPPAPTVTDSTATDTTATTDPAAATDPAVMTDPAATDPVATDPVATDPAATTTAPATTETAVASTDSGSVGAP
jgi:hypothetical protein